jgi:hypothetical protein
MSSLCHSEIYWLAVLQTVFAYLTDDAKYTRGLTLHAHLSKVWMTKMITSPPTNRDNNVTVKPLLSVLILFLFHRFTRMILKASMVTM